MKPPSASKPLMPDRLTPSGVALRYAAFAALWIISSGYLLTFTVDDPLLQGRIELAKGLAFVAVTGGLLYLLLKGWHESIGVQQTTVQADGIAAPKTTRLVPIFIALVLVVPLIDFAIYKLHVPQTELDTYDNLKSIAQLKAGEIENWLSERRGDAQGLTANAGFAQQVEHFLLHQKHDASLPRQILNELHSLQANYGYDSILLLDTGGRLLSSMGKDVDTPPSLQHLLRQALSGKQIQFSNLYRDEAGNINLDWVVPIIVSDQNGRRAVATVVLRVLPEKFLYPRIQTWPTASTSGEILLVRREGESVLFLNQLRLSKIAAMTIRGPLSDPALPAATAIRDNKPGTVSGTGSRHVQVFAAYRPVAGTDWHLIAKIDRDEVMMPVWNLLYWISVIASIAVVLVMIALLMLLRQQQRSHQLALLASSAAALRESELRYRTLVGAIPDLIWLKDKNGIYLNCNRQFEMLYGAKEADIIGKSDYDFVDKELADSFREHDLKGMAAGKPSINEEWLTFAGNGYRGLFETIKIPVQDANGNLIGVLGIARDITKRKLAEESLRKLSQAVEQSPSTIVITDLKANIEYANAAFVKESGYSLAEAIGSNPRLLHSGKTPKSTYDDMWAHLTRGESWKGEFINRRKDGSEYIELALISPVFQADGRMTHYLAIKENITERKQTEKALHDSRESLGRLLNSMAEGAYGVDTNGICTFVNRAFLQMLGYQNDNEVLGKHIHELIHHSHPDGSPYPESECRAYCSYRADQPITASDEVFWRKDGVAVPVEYWSHNIATGGVTIGAIVTFFDITNRKAAEEKIHRLTQLYAALSQCNQAIVRCASEAELFPQICRDAVRFGGMSMAWIGLVDEASKQVKPVASYGTGTEYLEGIKISVDAGDPFGRGPTGTAIRDNQPYWNQDFQLDLNTAPWRERREKYGWKSSAALPLLRNGIPFGSLTLYSDTVNAFDEEARRLLVEMAMDISFALDNFVREAERKHAEQELMDSEQRFRGLVEQSLAGIYIVQDGKLVYVNPRCAEILGLGSADELVGKDLLQYVAEAERGKLMENIGQLINKEIPSITSEYTLLRRDGVSITVGASGTLATYHGQPAIIGLAQDISEKKRDEQRISNYIAQLKATFLSTVQMATSLSEMRDPYTAGHERRVAEIAVAIATALGWDEQRIEGLRIAGFLHDIGKISIPAEILVKPGRLTATELSLVQGHAQASYDVLKHVEFPWPVATIALQHHERMDGSGYPNGLKGDEILLESRIMAVADVVEAMASHRPYRPGLGIEKALAEIERGSGTGYDPVVADACLRLFREQGFVLPAN